MLGGVVALFALAGVGAAQQIDFHGGTGTRSLWVSGLVIISTCAVSAMYAFGVVIQFPKELEDPVGVDVSSISTRSYGEEVNLKNTD